MSIALRHAFSLPLCSLVLLGCAQTPRAQAAKPDVTPRPSIQQFVSDTYPQRAQGYDWMAISVTEESPQRIAVSVRSRHDQKKPSCTLDTYAQKIDAGAYQAMVHGQPINFTLSAQELVISAPTPDALKQLFYYCSGGASLNGAYQKLDAPLDTQQLDPRPFRPEAS